MGLIPAILFNPSVRVLHLLRFELCNTLLSHEAIRVEDLVVKYRGLWTRRFFLSVSGCRYQGNCLVKKVVKGSWKGSSCLTTPQILLWEKCHCFSWVWNVFILHSFIPTECISTNKKVFIKCSIQEFGLSLRLSELCIKALSVSPHSLR